ncbi:YihY/virulence factor BrkB family protein [Kovacikia minuta CCNUW1]|uniref:YihY/virulence factor BrkB family protein n=1 Tax=Kovacikia minuta TaxID=2931930 RepID=UPI001CCDABF5|nr:YihY/virulence factor BrkB family protein [Kovacikia minuta]UBF24653.1 YihY/virulence factor BrkB family protein [Kovacikia minuta CCNUW1]
MLLAHFQAEEKTLTRRFFRFWKYLTPAIIWEILKRTGSQRLPGLAAEMAYNAILALFPAIVAILASFGLVRSSEQTLLKLADQLAQVIPVDVLTLIQNFIQEVSQTSNQGLFSISFVVSLWAASSVLSAAMSALDQIHQVPPSRMRPFWKAKLVSLGLTIGTILFLILASTVVFISDVAVQTVAVRSGGLRWSLLNGWQLLSLPLALGIVILAFAFIYRYGPSRWTSGTPILPGAILAAAFWAILSSFFRFYVSQFGQYSRIYGAIGAVIVLLLWLYLCALALLIGAQLNVTVGAAMRSEQKQRQRRVKREGVRKF